MLLRLIFFVALLVLPAGCVGGEVANNGECPSYRFEGGVEVPINRAMVGVMNPSFIGRRGPTVLMSMEVHVPRIDQIESLSGLKSVHLSAFFVPLEAGQVECQEIQGARRIRCYVDLQDFPLQLSGVFDVSDNDEFNAGKVMGLLGANVKESVLACP